MMPRLKPSWLAQLAALERKPAEARKTRYLWLDEGQTMEEVRNAAIAAGKARATDRFVFFHWRSPGEPPPDAGGDGGAP
jgi:hypothetical protein